jgi:two-component system chemotaxis response regulator CheB
VLNYNFDQPLMVVQHITPGLASDFAKRLSRESGLKLGAMTPDEPLLPGHLYIPLGDYHIGVKHLRVTLKLTVSHEAAIRSHWPSVDYLFHAVALTHVEMFAAVMTGMGRDGAEGLLALKQKGAFTCAQTEVTSAIYGMPKEAIKLNAALFIGSPSDIRQRLDEELASLSTGTPLHVARA